MKKIIMFGIIALLAVAFVSAADSFTVQSVTGSVIRASGAAVRAGETLDGSVVIRTGVGASIVLLNPEGASVTVPAARNGTVDELTKAAAGVRIGGNVTRTDTGAATRTGGLAGTASARASDQAGDEDIAAE